MKQIKKMLNHFLFNKFIHKIIVIAFISAIIFGSMPPPTAYAAVDYSSAETAGLISAMNNIISTLKGLIQDILSNNQASNVSAASGMTAGYSLDEGTGTVANDSSGNNLNGTLSGATWTASGKYGSALSFNGSSAYVNLANPSLLQITGSMTISAWINSSVFPADDAAIVSKRDSGSGGYQLDTTIDKGPRTIGFKLGDSSSVNMARYGNTAMSLNTWYYVTGVYDAQAQTMHVYLNGNLDDGSLTGTVTSSQVNSSQNVNIGRRPGYAGFAFNGKIDEVRIYNRALSQSEIQADMNASIGNPPPPDTTAPSTPTNLSATAISSSQINLSWTASTDDVAVTGYKVFRGGTQVGTSSSTTYSDTGLTASTTYTYTVSAYDAAGNNSSQSTSASATTQAPPPPDTTPPTVSITAPSSGATVSSSITVSANASDNVGVVGVQFKLDGANLNAEDTTSPYSITWDTTTATNASHSLTATARDAAGNTTTATSVSVTVNNVSSGTTYYVSPTGNDSANGSLATPWKTLQKAAYSVVAGDTVIVAAGTYVGFAFQTGIGTQQGTASKPITFIANTGDYRTSGVIINAIPSISGVLSPIWFWASGYITIKGFNVTSNSQKGDIQIAGGSPGIKIYSSHTYGTPYWGIKTGAGSDGLVIQDSLTENSSGQHGIYVSGTNGYIIRNNISRNNNEDGIHTNVEDGGNLINTNGLIENNIIYGNALAGMDLTGMNTSIVRNNLVYNNGRHAIVLQNSNNNPTPANHDNLIVNNTLDALGGDTAYAIEISALYSQPSGSTWTSNDQNTTVTNNILLANTSAGNGAIGDLGTVSSTFTSDYNIVVDHFQSGGTSQTLAQWRTATGEDTHSIISTVAALFVNAAGGDYHLKSGSPAIDKGTSTNAPTTDLEGNSRPQGVTYDIGTYESASSGGGDTTPPSTPTGLTATATSSSQINLSWTASTDNVGVTGYKVFRAGTQIATSATTTYSDAGLTASTTYSYTVSAYDAAGNNSSQSSSASATTQAPPTDTTPPTVSITAPANNATVSGSATTVSANASDNVGVVGVQFKLDGTNLQAEDTTSPYSITWDTTTATNASHSLTATARDAAGNTTTSATITVTVSNAPADTTPPVISAVTSSAIITTGATITWTTNENSDSQVEYGTTTAYGTSTTLNATMVTSHSVALVGLTPSTLYHYRVKSKDAAGNLATSGDFTFTTTTPADTTPPSTPTGLSATAISSSQINLAWTASTDNVGVTGYKIFRAGTQIATSATTTYSDTGLAASTNYSYAVSAYDAAGNNSSQSTSANATTQAPPDTTSPIITNVNASSITTTGATITWTTNELSDSQVDYGTTAAYGTSTTLNATMVTSHSVILSGLNANTLYHYRVKSKDAAGNLATSVDFTFNTSAPVDTTPPIISSVASGSITSTGASITWTTNEASDSQVEYGTTTAYGTSTTLNASMVTNHTVALTGLNSATLYHYRVKSKDAAGNLANSADQTFTTLPPPDTTPPIITNIATSNITSNSVTITWTTNENADTQVDYGTTISYGQSTTLNTTLLTAHSVSLTSLSAGNTYHFKVKSKDAAGNLAQSTDQVVVTSSNAPPPDTTPPVISNVTSTGITNYAATITWTTDEASTSKVNFGTSTAYTSSSQLDTTLVLPHAVALSNLKRNTTYHYQAESQDASNNVARSTDVVFKTLQRLSKPPKGGNLSAVNGSVILAWTVPLDSDNVPYELYAGALIARSTQAFIQTPDPATAIADVKFPSLTWHDTTAVNGTIYYYSLFTYDDQGNYSDPSFISFTPTTSSTGGGGGGGGTSGTILAPTAQISADHTIVTPGATVTLTYTTSGANSVVISPDIGTVGGSGSQTVTPTKTTTYTITATNVYGSSVNATVTITVGNTTFLGGTTATNFTACTITDADVLVLAGEFSGIQQTVKSWTSAPTATQLQDVLQRIKTLSDKLSVCQPASPTQTTPAPTSEQNYVFARYLGLGDGGQDVTELQKLLMKLGYLHITATTGYYGPATYAAVRAYQASHNLTPATGNVGPKTKSSINTGK